MGVRWRPGSKKPRFRTRVARRPQKAKTPAPAQSRENDGVSSKHSWVGSKTKTKRAVLSEDVVLTIVRAALKFKNPKAPKKKRTVTRELTSAISALSTSCPHKAGTYNYAVR